ncbi:putative pre-mRNA-splicing factor 18 [Apostichopus japonicus]|nr:putative pre-mRNA-splicing factor 18 [Apostichopus japonicus]
MKGKLQTATYSQTSAYLEPLVRKLKRKTLPPDLLDSLVQIVKFMLEREYVKANDEYLQMAIGNAPWPIGVTMVGIHARTGREKIYSKNVARIL